MIVANITLLPLNSLRSCLIPLHILLVHWGHITKNITWYVIHSGDTVAVIPVVVAAILHTRTLSYQHEIKDHSVNPASTKMRIVFSPPAVDHAGIKRESSTADE